MINIHNLTFIAFLETRMKDHKSMVVILRFSNLIQFPASRNFGGIVIMYDNCSITIQDITISPQVIHTTIKVNNPPFFGSLALYMLVIPLKVGGPFRTTSLPLQISSVTTPTTPVSLLVTSMRFSKP